MRAEAYDVVLNGVELGGGSIRIHEPELQAKMFAALGVSEQRISRACSATCCARSVSGAPPHGGIALGLDRIVMLICGEESIREVMAFPKNNRGIDLMSQSPSEVDPRQLRDLGTQARLAKSRSLDVDALVGWEPIATCASAAAIWLCGVRKRTPKQT